MARIPYPDPESLSKETTATLGAIPEANIFRLLAQADGSLTPFVAFTLSLWNDAELSARRRELAILLVARLADCDYEWKQHEAVAKASGVTDEEIAAIEDLELDRFDEAERAMLELARITFERGRPDDSQLAAARAALSDREVIELQLVVSVYAGLAAIMLGLDLELDETLGADQLEEGEGGLEGPMLVD